MTHAYLQSVGAHLTDLSPADRRPTLEALAAQLAELEDLGVDPADTLGDPADYAAVLTEALHEPDEESVKVLGVPVETRGPVNSRVRSRIWDPTNPRLFVPRLFGVGWDVNLGALAVRAGLLRPDDADAEVLAAIPARAVRLAQAVPVVVAASTALGAGLAWKTLPERIASGFGATGRARGTAPRWTMLAAVALGSVPAVRAARSESPVEDRLVRAASATGLAFVSASIVAATVLEARRPGGRWGLLSLGAVPVGLAASVAVVALPVRAGLRARWREVREG